MGCAPSRAAAQGTHLEGGRRLVLLASPIARVGGQLDGLASLCVDVAGQAGLHVHAALLGAVEAGAAGDDARVQPLPVPVPQGGIHGHAADGELAKGGLAGEAVHQTGWGEDAGGGGEGGDEGQGARLELFDERVLGRGGGRVVVRVICERTRGSEKVGRMEQPPPECTHT